MSILAFALPASAMADVNLEGEAMTWPADSGAVQQDGGRTVYHLTTNGRGNGTVTASDPTALVSVTLRTEQTGMFCQGNPQFSLYVDNSKRAVWTLAAGSAYTTFSINVDAIGTFAIDPGSHSFGISLDNETTGVLGCDRGLFVDKVTLTTRPAQMFGANNWRNTPLAANAALDADQSAKDKLVSQVASFGTFVNDADSFSVPVYTVRADQPTSRVYQDTRWQKYFGSDATEWDNQFMSVPVPSGAKASGPCDGTSDGETYTGCGSHNWGDREIAIYQPSTDTLWELYHFVKSGGQWAATDGGRISNVSQNSTIQYDVPKFPSGAYHGVAATRIPLLATLQRTREVLTGQINHPVTIHIPHVLGPGLGQVLPALDNDGDFTTVDAIKEGTRFRLPASYDVESIPNTYLRAFARAVRDYGMIVTDKDCHNDGSACAAVTTIVEDPAPTYGTTDPYSTVIGNASTALAGFPWSSLQVVAPTT